jgi:DNA repair photolyase
VALRPVSNPPNPWLSSEVEYLPDEIPEARLEIFEDHTRTILATNDSPDLGFDYSVNPYRGCQHACAYCMSGDTEVLMGDGTTRELRALRVGDVVYGTELRGRHRRYVRTSVLAHWSTVKPAYRVGLADGSDLIASRDHRFLTVHGWKFVSGSERPHLTGGDRLLGFGARSPRHLRRIEAAEVEAFLTSLAMCVDFTLPPKGDLEGVPLMSDAPVGVTAVEALRSEMPMFDITTGTGDFIANGIVSHNCYARPGHEYLSFGAGSDFDRKIVVKPRAAELLREAFDKKSWRGELVVFSGVTDCYQPLEASYRLTRRCLEVCAEYRNPVGIITKAPLIERDLDVLVRLSEVARVGVTVSVPLWDPEHARAMEPQVATPQRRMKTIARLAAAGLDVGVNVAPVIPGLGDQDIAEILTAAAAAGARRAGCVFLRLPGPVATVFEERVRASLPLRAERILSHVREARGGKLYDSRFGKRQRGEGPYADAIQALFDKTCAKLGLNRGHADERGPDEVALPSTFARPVRAGDQLKLL